MSKQDDLFEQLKTVADDVEIRKSFTDELEVKLYRIHQNKYGHKRGMRGLRWIAAIIIIISAFAIVMSLPSAQVLAKTLMSYFFRTDGETIYVDSYSSTVTMIEFETIEEAETYAGFQVYELPDATFDLIYIHAQENGISLLYEENLYGDRGNVIAISQLRTGTRSQSPFNAVPEHVEIVPITIHDFIGEYVEGYWFSYADDEVNEYTWVDNHFRQLHWVTDEFDFTIKIAASLVSDAEDATEIAESLEIRP